MTDIILRFWVLVIIVFVFKFIFFFVDASSNSEVPSVDLEDFRRTLIWK